MKDAQAVKPWMRPTDDTPLARFLYPVCPHCLYQHAPNVLCWRAVHPRPQHDCAHTVPIRHLLPGVTGELLARCHNDAQAANRALHAAPHATRPPHQYEFKVGTRWRDTKDQQGFARRIVTVAGNHGHRITFLRPWLKTTFSLPRHVARHRMRRVEE